MHAGSAIDQGVLSAFNVHRVSRLYRSAPLVLLCDSDGVLGGHGSEEEPESGTPLEDRNAQAAFFEALAQYRQADGLPTLVVAWKPGVALDVGQSLAMFDAALASSETFVVVTPVIEPSAQAEIPALLRALIDVPSRRSPGYRNGDGASATAGSASAAGPARLAHRTGGQGCGCGGPDAACPGRAFVQGARLRLAAARWSCTAGSPAPPVSTCR